MDRGYIEHYNQSFESVVLYLLARFQGWIRIRIRNLGLTDPHENVLELLVPRTEELSYDLPILGQKHT
jgi:hypothetical protein